MNGAEACVTDPGHAFQVYDDNIPVLDPGAFHAIAGDREGSGAGREAFGYFGRYGEEADGF